MLTVLAQESMLTHLAVAFDQLPVNPTIIFMFLANMLFFIVRIGMRMRPRGSSVSYSSSVSRKPRQSARTRKRRGDEHLGPPETW